MANGDFETDRRQSESDILVMRSKDDSNAFILLYDIYYEKILRHCLSRLRTRQISEDITSMVFLRAAADIRQFHGKTRRKFVEWLFSIAEKEITRCSKNKQFADSIKQFDPALSESINSGHKEKLRAKILPAFGTGETGNNQKILYFAATIIVIAAAGFLLLHHFSSLNLTNSPSKSVVATVQKPQRELAPIRRVGSAESDTAKPAADEPSAPVQPNDIDIINETATISIGGIVQGQESEPIGDASVKIIAANTTKFFKTDAKGMWIWEDLPADVCFVSIMATHPDYVLPERLQKVSVKQLKDISYVTVLEKGITVIGNVVDWENRPLQAKVTKGPFPKDSGDTATCDANGWFRFNKAEPGIEIFTAQCEEAAPKIMPVEIKSGMSPIVFTLEQPNIISGQIVDINDMPIKDASVSVAFWEGVGALNFSTKTDDNGFFQWADAPADEVLFNIQKKGCMSLRNFAMQSGIDYKIPLMQPFKISGNIISGSPDIAIETFIITTGYYFEEDKVSWQDADSVVFSGDKYELNITEPVDFKLKIQCESFESAESPVFHPLQFGSEYDFVLRPEP